LLASAQRVLRARPGANGGVEAMANQATSVYSHDLRDELATPLCGAHRPNRNPLLFKNELGCVKPSYYDLPSKGNLQHEYGLRQERDGTCSAEVLGNWAQHEPNPNVQPGRDFKQLNRKAVVAGLITCKDHANYRKTNDCRLKFGSEKTKEKLPYDPVNTSFGRPTNTSENFNDLFSHGYRYDWVADATPASEACAAKQAKKPAMTKTAIALRNAAKEKMADKEVEKEWKMPAFENVPAKLGRYG